MPSTRPGVSRRDFALEYAALAKSFGATAFIPLTAEWGTRDLLGARKGTINGGVTWKDARTARVGPPVAGRVAEFNGTSGYVEFPHDTAYSFATKVTVVQWLCPGDAANYGETIAKGTDWTTNQNFRVVVKSGDTLIAWRNSSDNTSYTNDVTESPFSTVTNGTWVMRAWRLETGVSSSQLKNEGTAPGVYASAQHGVSSGMKTNSQALRVGADPSVPRYFKGSIAYTMLFPLVLTDPQVKSLYRFGIGR